MERKDEIIGRGWAFPPAFIKEGQNEAVMSTGIAEINESLRILLNTTLGERVMQPKYGSAVKRMLFEPLSGNNMALMKKFIQTAILLHEKRIKVESISLEPEVEEGYILIKVDYRLLAVNSRFNFVYPFYLEEANGQP